MWKHRRYASIFIGSYDYDKKGLRFFELTGMVGGKTKRLKFKSVKDAKLKEWKKVR